MGLSKKEIIDFLNSDGDELFFLADKIRKENKGDIVHLRGLIEFSNFCKNGCKYCGIRAQNSNVERYRLLDKDILNLVKKAADSRYKTIVLQSGEDPFFTKDRLVRLIEKIKEFNLALTLSIGEKSREEYEAYKKAGCDRYLIRIETTDKALYEKMHPNMSFENRLRCLYDLKELGFEVGTGSLIGLPNQSIESLSKDILFFKQLNADMIGIGPFIPHPDTPLRGETEYKNFEMALKVMAVTRILLPDINIPATTAMETFDRKGRLIALQSGANVIMQNITSENCREKYEIYPNKAQVKGSIEEGRAFFEKSLQSIGRKIALSKGFRKDNF